MARQWCCLARMDESRLNQKVFVWSVGKKDWMVNVRSYFQKINMEHILDIDSDRDLKAIMTELDLSLTQYYEQQWHAKLQRQLAIRGSGQNKLRTYRQFKFSPQPEQYLKIVMPQNYEWPALTPEQRICHFCALNEPETEEHVITRCTQYNDIRMHYATLS